MSDFVQLYLLTIFIKSDVVYLFCNQFDFSETV